MLSFVTSPWILPVLLTAAIWLAAIAWPWSGISLVISVLLRFSAAAAATIIVWGAALLWFFFGRNL